MVSPKYMLNCFIVGFIFTGIGLLIYEKVQCKKII
jgi:hypothetical protein